MTFLSWFFPWGHLDIINKFQLVIWLSQLGIAGFIWVWIIMLKKPFLVSNKVNQKDEGQEEMQL